MKTPFVALASLIWLLPLNASAQAQVAPAGTPAIPSSYAKTSGPWPTAESAATHTSPIDKEMEGLTHKPPVPLSIPDGPFQPTWDSLRANYKVPEWFMDAKFGIYIHWGLYSVAAYHNEWYSMHMYNTFADYHARAYGPQTVFGYKDFIPLFKAEKYDPVAWAELFKKSGAKYVVPVVEHHDGFAMYDSDLTIWCASKMGPKRDLMGDLAKAVSAEGLIFGVSNHRMEHHTFMYPKAGLANDQFDPKYAEFYGPPQPGGMNDSNASPAFQAEWLARMQEIADKYHPQMFIFDNGVNNRAYDDVKLKFAAYYYNEAAKWHLPVSIDTKDSAYLAGSIQDYENTNRMPPDLQATPWQVEVPIGSVWGYSEQNAPISYKNAGSLINLLITVVSRNGCLLLNISPRGDGTIPQEQQDRLRAMGQWLEVNGEAIYGTRPWAVSEESSTVHFTTKNGALYVIISNAQPGATMTVQSLPKGYPPGGSVNKVELLGQTGTLPFTQDANGLQVKLPETLPSQYASVLKVDLNIPRPNTPAAGATVQTPPQ